MSLLRSKGSGLDSQSATVWPDAAADAGGAAAGPDVAGAHAATTATVVASRATTVRDMRALLKAMVSNHAGVKVRKNPLSSTEIPPTVWLSRDENPSDVREACYAGIGGASGSPQDNWRPLRLS